MLEHKRNRGTQALLMPLSCPPRQFEVLPDFLVEEVDIVVAVVEPYLKIGHLPGEHVVGFVIFLCSHLVDDGAIGFLFNAYLCVDC